MNRKKRLIVHGGSSFAPARWFVPLRLLAQRMFKPSRAIVGDITTPRCFSLLQGSCLSSTAGGSGSRMEVRTDLLWKEKPPKEK